MTLSHGWGFSINKSLVKVIIKEETIVTKRTIYDYMLVNSLKPHTVEISNKLILSGCTSYQKYHQHIEEAKKLTESNQRESEKQSLTNEIDSYHNIDLKKLVKYWKRILFA